MVVVVVVQPIMVSGSLVSAVISYQEIVLLEQVTVTSLFHNHLQQCSLGLAGSDHSLFVNVTLPFSGSRHGGLTGVV